MMLPSASLAGEVPPDQIPTNFDNCDEVWNPDQTNSDFDPYGNACDLDFDQDGDVDTEDRDLLIGEIGQLDPRLVTDLTGDGDVTQADLDYFNDFDPADRSFGSGSFDPDSICQKSDYRLCMESCTDDLETCIATCNADGAPFVRPWDPSLHPNLLVNGELDGDGTAATGWTVTETAYQPWISLSGSHAFQWHAFVRSGGVGQDVCYRGCFAAQPVPVSPNRSYAFTYFTCAAEFPPTTQRVFLEELDANHVSLGTIPSTSNDSAMGTWGVWEEKAFFFTVSNPATAFVRPKLWEKSGPNPRADTFFDDFKLHELDATGNPSFESPPAPKRAFDGARVRVDALGNVEVLDEATAQWEPFFPIAIWGNWARDFADYTSMGFNTIVNWDGRTNGIPTNAKAAGMMFMLKIDSLWRGEPGDPINPDAETALNRIKDGSDGGGGTPGGTWDALLGFFSDNEAQSDCVDLDGSGVCTTRWVGNEPVFQEIRAFDRAENGGAVGEPFYFNNNNPNISPAFANDVINAEGDRRMDIVGAGGAVGFENLQQSENQTAPAIFQQAQAHNGDLWRPQVWASFALGGRGINVWRDAGGNGGLVSGAPWLRICGVAPLPVLDARTTLLNPSPSTIIRGENGARAEIVTEGSTSTDDCPVSGETGQVYTIKMERNGTDEYFFQVGDELFDDATGDPLDAINPVTVGEVDEGSNFYLLKWRAPIDVHQVSTALPDMAADLEALEATLRLDHRPSWSFDCSATLANSPSVQVQFGNQGLVCGARDYDGFLIVANTWHRIDPFGPMTDQHVGEPIDVTIQYSDLPFTANSMTFWDFETHSWSTSSLPVANGLIQTQLDPFEVAIIKLSEDPPQ